LVNCIPQNLESTPKMLAAIEQKTRALVGGLTAA